MRDRLPLLIVGILIVGGLLLLFGMNRDAQERRINRSVVGFALVPPWLESQGIEAEESNPRLSPPVDSLSLRIMPLHDMDLTEPRFVTSDPRNHFYSSTLIDADYDTIVDKMYEMPTMIVPPKWVAGTFSRKILHRSALIPLDDYATLIDQLYPSSRIRMTRPGQGLLTTRTEWGQVALFEPQLFDPDSLPERCFSMLGLPEGVLVARCDMEDDWPLYLVSDPDLLNNQGLTLGDNGAVVAGLMRAILAGDTRPVYLDTHDAIYTNYWSEDEVSDQRRDYERDGSAFARFFEPPLAALWAIMFVILGVCFWRGAVRFGPLLALDRAGTEPSKTAAISTKARLLRLSGHDGQLVADYVRADLAHLARQIFGGAAAQAGQARLFSHLARRDAPAAEALQQIAEKLIRDAPQMSHSELTRLFDTYRSLMETLTHGHDPDRVPKPR